MKKIIWLLEDGSEIVSKDTWYNGELSLLEYAIKERALGFHKETGMLVSGISKDRCDLNDFNIIKSFKIVS